ncbi:MAG: ATP-binding cassette domain-containing protein [Pseudomonadota bacterium]
MRFEGRDITRPAQPSNLRSRHRPGRRGRQVFPTMTVRENLEMGAVIPRARRQRAQSMDRVLALFPRLSERLAQHAGTLSGGEQQMLAIGRCLMGRPTLIMFDEPSLGLAPTIVHDVFAIVRALARRRHHGHPGRAERRRLARPGRPGARARERPHRALRHRPPRCSRIPACSRPIWGL